MGLFELVAPNFTSKGGEGWTEAPSECLVDVVQVLYLHGTCFYAAIAVHSREAQLYFVACVCGTVTDDAGSQRACLHLAATLKCQR